MKRGKNMPNDKMQYNLIIAKNISDYINAIEKSKEWVSHRSGISQVDFDCLLEGKGNLKRDIPKLNKLFRIQDPHYFYNEKIKLPMSLEKLEATSLRNFSLKGDNTDSEAFKNTMCILDDVINMINTLKTAKDIG